MHHQLFDHFLQTGQTLGILMRLFTENAFSWIYLRHGHVLADVLFGFFVHHQITHQAIFGGHDDHQFIAPDVLHSQYLFTGGVFIKRCDDIDWQLVFAAKELVVELAWVLIILLVVIVANFSRFDHTFENRLFELCKDVCGVYIGVFDFLLYIFFFVCEKFVQITIALHVGLLFQRAEGGFYFLLQLWQVLIKAVQH